MTKRQGSNTPGPDEQAEPTASTTGAGSPAEPVTLAVDEHGEVIAADDPAPAPAGSARTPDAADDEPADETADEAHETEGSPATGGTTPSSTRARRAPVLAGVAVVLAAALLVGAVVLLVSSLRTSSTASEGAQRDTALEAARTIANTLTTVDGTDVAGTLTSWDAVVTGPLAQEFANSRAQLEQRATQGQASVTSTVANAALTEIDDQAGTAAALIFVDATTRTDAAGGADPSAAPSSDASAAPSTDPSADPSVAPGGDPAAPADDARSQRLALTMTLTKVDGVWKAANLEPVAQGATQ